MSEITAGEIQLRCSVLLRWVLVVVLPGLASSILAASAGAAGRQLDALTVEDALRTRTFGELMPIGFSPDGRWLAYTIRDSQRTKPEDSTKWIKAGRLRFVAGDDIVVCNLETGTTQNLTGGTGDNWLPTWSPDGHSLAFLSDRSETGKAKIWIWKLATKEMRQVGDADFMTTQMEWTPDGRELLLTALPQTDTSRHDVTTSFRPSEVARSTERVGVGSTVVLYRSRVVQNQSESTSDPWNLDDARRDLVAVDVLSGRSTLLVHDERIATFRLAPDGKRVAYSYLQAVREPRLAANSFRSGECRECHQEEPCVGFGRPA